jgi:hypothetical protein
MQNCRPDGRMICRGFIGYQRERGGPQGRKRSPHSPVTLPD